MSTTQPQVPDALTVRVARRLGGSRHTAKVVIEQAARTMLGEPDDSLDLGFCPGVLAIPAWVEHPNRRRKTRRGELVRG